MATVAVEARETSSYISWGAAFAGAAVASALSFVFLTFGSAVGFSLLSPWTTTASSAKWTGAVAVFWIVAQQIGSFLAGGYIAGRMRARWQELSADEVEFRDGLHGGLTWAIGVLMGAALLASGAMSAGRVAGDLTGRLASTAASQTDPLSYQVDVLLRAGTGQTAPPGGDANAVKAEVLRIFAKAATSPDGMTRADRAYLAQLVAQRTGLSQQDAEARVTQVVNDATRIAKESADTARKTAVATGFLTAASLLLSLAAAWWAAQRGGHHRDTARAARFF